MSRYTVRRHPNEQHIGDADGRIALWLNEQSAHDLAAMFRWPDVAGEEILEAIERAYPADSPPCDGSADCEATEHIHGCFSEVFTQRVVMPADSQEDKT